jgi:anti-sigma B factor antagonist
MEISTRTEDEGYTVIEINGAIDGSSAPILREAIEQVTQDSQELLLDMQNVHFMSSAGLRVMLLLHRHLQQNDGRVVLVGMLEPIYDAMEATGFLKYFETAPDIDTGKEVLRS